jgi:hypothetical protein
MHRVAAFLAEILRVYFGTRGQVERIEGSLERLLPALALGLVSLVVISRLVAAILARAGSAPMVESTRQTWRTRDAMLALTLALAAAVLRAPGLQQSLWLDELGTFRVFVEPGLSASLFPRVALGPQPFLHWLVFPFYWLFDHNDAALRLPVLIAAAGSVPALYLATVALGMGRVAGLVSAVCLLLHSFHVFYSFQLRAYGLLGLFAIVSTMSFTQLVLSQGLRGRQLYLLGTVLLLYTHVYSAPVLVAQMATWGLLTTFGRGWHPSFSRQAALRVLDAILVVCLISALIYLPYVPILLMIRFTEAAGVPSLVQHVASAMPGLVSMTTSLSVALSVIVAGLAGGLVIADPRVRLVSAQLTLSLLLFLLVPPGGTGFQARYLFPLVPLMTWTIGLVSVALLRRWAAWGGLAGSGLVVVYVAATVGGLHEAFRPIQPFRDAVEVMRLRAGVNAVFAGNSLGKDLIQYYEPKVVPLRDPEHLRDLVRANREVWIVSSYEAHTSEFYASDVQTQREIERRFERVAVFPGMVPVTLWRTPEERR